MHSTGLHHVTAIAGPARRNLDFYTRSLGLRPEALSGAVLLRAMVPLASPPEGAIEGTPVLMLSGAMDPIMPQPNAARLATLLGARGAQVEHRVLPAGHGLTAADMIAARDWLAAKSAPRAA